MYPPPQVSNYIAELFKPDSPAFGELWLDGEKVNNQKIQIIIIIKLCVCVCVCVCVMCCGLMAKSLMITHEHTHAHLYCKRSHM
jgi:hypothetical protein